jgi:acetoacetyl-CoA synthetase
MSGALWFPSSERIERTNLVRFMRFVRNRHHQPVPDYRALYRWSIEFPEHFWAAVWDFCEVRATTPWSRVLTEAHRLPGARWFEGAELNYAANLLRHDDERTAVIFRGTEGARRAWSFQDLQREVARIAAALRAAGIAAGDRVAALSANVPEIVAAQLAAASLGAVWSACPPSLGTSLLLTRLQEFAPKVLIVSDGHICADQSIALLPLARSVTEHLSCIKSVLVVPYLTPAPDLSDLPNAISLASVPPATAAPTFASLPFEHPLFALFSSGTQGLPKGVLHGAGGVLLQHLKELALHTDVGANSRLLISGDCASAQWHWSVSALATGASLVICDGVFDTSDLRLQWRMLQEEGVSVFGTTPRFLLECQKAGLTPRSDFNFDKLETLLVTGAPLAPQGFEYAYRAIKADLLVASWLLSADIASSYALACPTQPVYPGEIQCRGLGMRVEIVDERGRPVNREQGEVACTSSFPSVPLGLLNDANGKRYRTTYFERLPKIWAHGDIGTPTDHGGIVIRGQYESLLDIDGARLGAEPIYAAIEFLPEVREALAVTHATATGTRLLLFLHLEVGVCLDEVLEARVRELIATHASARHVPARIIQIAAIPRTWNGKRAALAVRNVLCGEPVSHLATLANPEALELYRHLPEA